MPSYRIYCYDGAGKLWVADSIEAESDEQALAEARSMKVAIKCEVWERDRLVGTVERSPPTSPQSGPIGT